MIMPQYNRVLNSIGITQINNDRTAYPVVIIWAHLQRLSLLVVNWW